MQLLRIHILLFLLLTSLSVRALNTDGVNENTLITLASRECAPDHARVSPLKVYTHTTKPNKQYFVYERFNKEVLTYSRDFGSRSGRPSINELFIYYDPDDRDDINNLNIRINQVIYAAGEGSPQHLAAVKALQDRIKEAHESPQFVEFPLTNDKRLKEKYFDKDVSYQYWTGNIELKEGHAYGLHVLANNITWAPNSLLGYFQDFTNDSHLYPVSTADLLYDVGDIVGTVLIPVGGDFIGDAIGLAGTYYDDDADRAAVNGTLYGTALFIEGVSAPAAKAIVSGGFLALIIRNGDKVFTKLDNAEDIKIFFDITDDIVASSLVAKAERIAKNDLLTELIQSSGKKTDLLADIGRSDELFDALDQNPFLVDAWEFVKKAMGEGSTSKKFLSVDILESVSKHLDDADFMKIIGNGDELAGKNAFGEMIKEYAGKCQACTGGNPSEFLPDNPQEYIDKVVALTKRYQDKGGIEIFKEAKKDYKSQEGAWFAMKKMDDLDPSEVSKIDAKFEGLPDDICDNCRFDVIMTNGTKLEYKSWGKVGVDFIASRKPGSSFYKQLMSYFSDASTVNISKIEYHFDPAKLAADGITNPETYVKGKFKTFFENNKTEVFETIWENQSLRNDLFGVIPENQLDALYNSKLNQFSSWVDELNPKIYNFIKVE